MATLLEQLLAQKALYAKQLNLIGRRWFTRNIIQYAQVTNPNSVLTEATSLLQKAKTLVVARLDTTRGSLVDDLKRTERNEIRARIVYGVLGNHPGIFLAGAGQNELLDFIVERRFRAIQRMLSFVNPNRTRQIMAYPPAGPLTAQVNAQTRTLWEGVHNIGGTKRYPFVLTAQGKLNPKEAIEKLFEKNADPSLANQTRVDCPAAAMCVHLDSLMVAKDPDKLAKDLAAVSNDHIAIDHAYGPWRFILKKLRTSFIGVVSQLATAGQNVDLKVLGVPRFNPPFGIDIVDKDGRQTLEVTDLTRDTPLIDSQVLIESSPLTESTLGVTQLGRAVPVGARLAFIGVPSFHAVSDPRPDSYLFEQSFISEKDLQVGDHIYVANHPIHRSRLGSTIWNGEHSFVVDPWQGSRNKMLVTGHGLNKPLTVTQVVWLMLEEINAFLEITRKMVDAWLAIPNSASPVAQGPATDDDRDELEQFLLGTFPLQGTIRAFNLPAVAYRKNGKDRTYPESWIRELEGTVEHEGISGTLRIDRKRIFIFDYDPERKTANRWPPPSSDITNRVAVEYHADLAALGGAAKLHYAVSYIDDYAGLLVYMPLYYPRGKHKGKPVRLTYNDIQDSVVLGTATDNKVYVIRPIVQSTPTYLAFLRQIGAIV